LRRLRARTAGIPAYAVGVSLGGNALLKWLGDSGDAAREVVNSAAAVSAPLDLMAAGEALGKGFNLVYTRNFLGTLKAKSVAKLTRFPGLYDAAAVQSAATLRDFDNLVTALPGPGEVSPSVTLEQPETGGHVGFVDGAFPGSFGWLPARVLGFVTGF